MGRRCPRGHERTFGLVADALAKDEPDGLPSRAFAVICDDLLEASVPAEHKHASTVLNCDDSMRKHFNRVD